MWVEATVIDCPSSDEIVFAYMVDGVCYKKVMNINSKHLRIANEYVRLNSELDREWFQLFIRRWRQRRDQTNDLSITADMPEEKCSTKAKATSATSSYSTACPDSSISDDSSDSCDHDHSNVYELPTEASDVCGPVSFTSAASESCGQSSFDDLAKSWGSTGFGELSFDGLTKSWRPLNSFIASEGSAENDIGDVSFASRYAELISHSPESVISVGTSKPGSAMGSLPPADVTRCCLPRWWMRRGRSSRYGVQSQMAR
jgi:hypothetical protein